MRVFEDTDIDALLHHGSREVLERVLEDPRLNEQHLLVLLSRKALPREILLKIGRNREWMSSYALKLAALRHPRTPREIAIPLLKFIYLFDLLGIALTPGVSPDLKRLAEDAILAKRESLALGQRISLARRGSARVAARMLADCERRVIEAALSNPVLTEQAVASALLLENAPVELTEAVLTHERWSARHAVKLALVRNPHLSLGRLMGILTELPAPELADVVSDRRVALNIRAYVSRTVNSRRNRSIQETEQL